MNLRILALLLLPLFAMAAPPPQTVELDLSATTRTFKFAYAEGTTPLIRCSMKNAGAAYTVTGWTGTLYLQATWEDTSIQAIPSTATSGSTIDFQLTANQTATSGVFAANFVMTDGTFTVEWQRGTVEVRDSPGTDGAGTLTLTTALNWGDYTYSNTGSEGPYRASTNITFTSNADGSQNIIAADTLGGLTPTAGRLIYGNGTAWTVLAPGTLGQVLAMGASLPAWAAAGAGDITGVTAGTGLSGGGASGDVTLTLANTAVTPGTYAPLTGTVDQQGRLTAASTTTESALAGILDSRYLRSTVRPANAVPFGYVIVFDGTQMSYLNYQAGVATVLTDDGAGATAWSATLPAVNGAAVTSLTAGNLTGTVPASSLGSGTANSTTYLRGDQTWAVVSAGLGGTMGATDNAATRADGTGAATAQGSDLIIEDVSVSTTNNIQLKNNHSGQTNSSFVISPKGAGAFIIGYRPDGTATGGNARGNNAVDLQMTRSSATQVASGANSAVLAGERNLSSGQYGVVSGGYQNTSSGYASTASGYINTASGSASIAIGQQNTASGTGAVAFGYATNASANYATVGGGLSGTATQIGATSIGGEGSNATATYATSLGGYNADASASYSLAGGRDTVSDQTYSLAIGYQSDTDHQGSLTLSNGRIAANGDSQTSITTARNKTTTATPAEIFLDGSAVRFAVASGISYACTVQVVGRSSGGESAAYTFFCLIENNGGTTSLIGGGTALQTIEDNAAWDCALTGDDTNDSLKITVTGAAATTITWSATILSTKAK